MRRTRDTGAAYRAGRWPLVLSAAGIVAVLATLPWSASGQAPPPELTRAVGRLAWYGVEHHDSEDPGGTWVTGQQAVIDVRLKRDTSAGAAGDAEVAWIDDGSSFRAQASWDYAVPFEDGECTVYRHDLYWLNVARFDATDPATGHLPSSILMRQDDGGQLTWMNIVMSGGPTAEWYRAHGGIDDTCAHDNGLRVLEWDALTSFGAYPWCPLRDGAAIIGHPDSSGTRIDFSCVDDQRGLTPDGARFWHLARMEGSLRLIT